MNKIVAIIPAKSNSTRIKNKNLKDFGNSNLLNIKIKQLKEVSSINRIIVNSDNDLIEKLCKSENVHFQRRPEDLSSENVPWSDVFRSMINNIYEEIIFLCFVTTPFITCNLYKQMIKIFYDNIDSIDSLIAVSKIQTHLINSSGKPLNFSFGDGHKNSQELDPIYEMLAGAYMIKKSVALESNYHIGRSPYIYEVPKINAIDINDEFDWELAKAVFEGLGDKFLYD